MSRQVVDHHKLIYQYKQPQYEVMNLKTFNNANIQKAMSETSDSQHSLGNFMDPQTIDFVSTQLVAKQSRVKIS